MYILEGCPKIISKSCSKNYIRKLSNSSCRRMSNELFQRVVQQFTSEDCPTYLFGELSNKILSKIDQCVFKNKTFVLKAGFSHLAYACVRELVRARDVGKGES